MKAWYRAVLTLWFCIIVIGILWAGPTLSFRDSFIPSGSGFDEVLSVMIAWIILLVPLWAYPLGKKEGKS